MILKYNESSEFGEVKNILNDLEGIMIELYDNHIDIDIEPSSDYAIELPLEELEYEGFYITFKHLSEKRKLYHLIVETIHMIIDYMNLKGFDTQILVLDNNSRHKGLGNREKVVTIEELGNIDDINFIEISFTKKKRNSHLNENTKIIDTIKNKKEETFNTLNSIAETISVDEGCRITFQHLSTLIIHPSRKKDYKITENLVDSIHTIVDYAKYRGYKSNILCNISGIVKGFNITNDIDKLIDKPFTKHSIYIPQIRIDFSLKESQIKMDSTNEILSFKNFIYKI
jgi:hypothetical protein